MELSYDTLSTILTLASSHERTSKQHEAEAQLKAWEVVPGFHYFLQQVYLNQELPLQMRWLAIICFKNGIDKYWRSSRPNAISKDEKTQIRARVFSLLGEKNNQLAVQNAHSIARIARLDYPVEWPTLFDDISTNLHEFVGANDLVSINNLLIILNRIIKTISTVRIGKARAAMQSQTPQLISILYKLYIKSFEEWTSSFNLSLVEVCYLSLKNLRRILPETRDQQFHTNPEIIQFLDLSVDHLQLLIVEHDKFSSDFIERYVRCYSKLYLDLISSNPTSFILLPSSKKILSTYLSLLEHKAEDIYNSSEENDFWEILALKGFLILKRIITYLFKNGSINLKQKNDRAEINQSIQELKQFFTHDLLINLCNIIITWYLKLKPSDIESWVIEPEEWYNEETSANWEFHIRSCAENFFMDLMKYFKDDLSGYVLGRISSNIEEEANAPSQIPDPNPQHGADFSDRILVKDAIFCTFQLSSHSISNQVDFDQLLTQIFLPQAYSSTRIIQRRICLVLNEWVQVQCSNENKIEIYKLIIHLLTTSNDKLVKIYSIQTLKVLVEDWEFVKKDFEPFLNNTIKLMVELLSKLSMVDSQLYVLDILSKVIEKSNPLVSKEILFDILSILPTYWESSTEQNQPIMKNSILRTLTSVVVTLNQSANQAHSFVLPLIFNCCSPESPNYSLLSEDGYDLWLATLQFTQSVDQSAHLEQLYKLIELLPYALQNATEILPTILSIVRSYSLFESSIFELEPSSPTTNSIMEIFKHLSGYLPTMRDDSYSIFIALMDILCLKYATSESFAKNLAMSGLVKAMFQYIYDDNQSISQVNKIFLVLSRLTKEPSLFLNLLGFLGIEPKEFIQKWLTFYNNNGNPRNKKINLMAIIKLTGYATATGLPLGPEFVEVAKKTFMFLEEVNESDAGVCDAYKEGFVYEDIDDYSYLDPDIKPNGEKIRYQALLEEFDPVYRENLKAYLRTFYVGVRDLISEEEFRSWGGEDAYLFEQFKALA